MAAACLLITRLSVQSESVFCLDLGTLARRNPSKHPRPSLTAAPTPPPFLHPITRRAHHHDTVICPRLCPIHTLSAGEQSASVAMTRPKVDPEKRQRIAQACDSCKRRKAEGSSSNSYLFASSTLCTPRNVFQLTPQSELEAAFTRGRVEGASEGRLKPVHFLIQCDPDDGMFMPLFPQEFKGAEDFGSMGRTRGLRCLGMIQGNSKGSPLMT